MSTELVETSCTGHRNQILRNYWDCTPDTIGTALLETCDVLNNRNKRRTQVVGRRMPCSPSTQASQPSGCNSTPRSLCILGRCRGCKRNIQSNFLSANTQETPRAY